MTSSVFGSLALDVLPAVEFRHLTQVMECDCVMKHNCMLLSLQMLNFFTPPHLFDNSLELLTLQITSEPLLNDLQLDRK